MEMVAAYCSRFYVAKPELVSHRIEAIGYHVGHQLSERLGFLSWYLAGKIKVFDRGGHVAKLCILLLPLLLAAMVGVSQVDDCWHHWQDVFTGGMLG